MSKRQTLLSVATAQVLALDSTLANDAIVDATANASSALVAVEKTVYEAEYVDITFMDILPVKNLGDPFATSFEYSYVQKAGKAKLAGETGEISWIDAFIGTKSVPLHDGNVGYKYSYKELGRASKLGAKLDPLKAEISMESALRLAQEIAYFGDADRGITGFYNDPDVPELTVSGGIAWSAKPAVDINGDLNNLFGTAYANSKQVEFKPNDPRNRLIVPTALYVILATKIINTVTGQTVLDYLAEHCMWLTGKDKIISSAEAVDVRIYQKDERKVCFYWGDTPKFLAPQANNLTLEVAGSFSIGGTVNRNPNSMYDLIGA